MELVVSDAHERLAEALRRCFRGATWQRCQTHFRRYFRVNDYFSRRQQQQTAEDEIQPAA